MPTALTDGGRGLGFEESLVEGLAWLALDVHALAYTARVLVWNSFSTTLAPLVPALGIRASTTMLDNLFSVVKQ